MGMRQLEAAILAELRQVKADKTIKQREIMEWSTGEIKPEVGEELIRLPDLGINVALKREKK